VLSGVVPVSKQLRDRVLKAVQELDFQPNHLARSLKIRQTKMIGMVIRDITDPVSPQMVRGAEDAAWKQGYLLVTLNSDNQWERERQIVTALRTHRVDGILLAMSAAPGDEHIRAVRDAGIPVVCLEREIPGLDLDCVLAGHFEGARHCVRHLASLGHRRIAWVSTMEGERFDGYRQGLRDGGLEFDRTLAAAIPQLLARDPRPTAILAADVQLALALVDALHHRNLDCPQDIAVATFDDSRFSEAIRPRLTAVAQPSYEMGLKAMELLIQRIQDPARPRTRLTVETSLHIRESTAAASDRAASAE
jgi:LacI family transcriptional regulator